MKSLSPSRVGCCQLLPPPSAALTFYFMIMSMGLFQTKVNPRECDCGEPRAPTTARDVRREAAHRAGRAHDVMALSQRVAGRREDGGGGKG